jgi:hypothetical protein
VCVCVCVCVRACVVLPSFLILSYLTSPQRGSEDCQHQTHTHTHTRLKTHTHTHTHIHTQEWKAVKQLFTCRCGPIKQSKQLTCVPVCESCVSKICILQMRCIHKSYVHRQQHGAIHKPPIVFHMLVCVCVRVRVRVCVCLCVFPHFNVLFWVLSCVLDASSIFLIQLQRFRIG